MMAMSSCYGDAATNWRAARFAVTGSAKARVVQPRRQRQRLREAEAVVANGEAAVVGTAARGGDKLDQNREAAASSLGSRDDDGGDSGAR